MQTTDKLILSASTSNDPVVELAVAEALPMVPFLHPERVTRAVFEPGVTDIEAAALLHAYLRGFRQRGGLLVNSEPVSALIHRSGSWTVSTRKSTWQTKTLINAAGAWADEMDVAVLVDWIERETLIPVQRISHSWAGLRS